MIIKCPQCSIGYNLPDSAVGDKPRKMRCSRCKHIFAITRRSDEAPRGYQEFTGKQHLPEEFAFLKESPTPQAPKQPSATPDSATAAQPAAAPAGLYQSVVQGASADTGTIPLEPKMVSGPTVQPQTPPEPPSAPESPSPTPESSSPAPQPAPAPEAPVLQPGRAASSPSVAEIYGGTTSSWEMEAPLELEGFALVDNGPEGNQFAGKIMFALIVLTISFFVFLSYRNGWSITFSDLPDQIAFAFSGEEFEDLPDEARDIQATVTKHTVIVAEDGTSHLTVKGEVTNSAISSRSNIILRGRLIDGAGDIRSEVRSPCGKTIDDETIKSTPKGSMQGHYRQGGELYNCTIRQEDSTVFQIIFEDLPADYDSSFQVQVSAVAAQAS